MDSAQIQANLERLFAKGARVVFWRDADAEFEDMVPILELGDIAVIHLSQAPALQVKTDLELEHPDRTFLLYETGPLLDPETDWLFDIRLYAEPFAADRSTMILKDLGLLQQSLRDHISRRSKFFASKERLAKAARLIDADADADAIDHAIMAVLLRIDQTDFFSILRALFHALSPDAMETAPPVWLEFEKYGVDDPFWRTAESHFGYRDETPTLKTLLLRLMLTDFSRGLAGDCPAGLAHLVLPATGAANALICMGQWRDSASRHASFDALSKAVGDLVRLDDHLERLDLEHVRGVRTFLAAEKFIARRLRDRVIETADVVDADAVRDLATRRHTGYWANDRLASSVDAPRAALSRVYDALVAAADLFDLKSWHVDGFNYQTPRDFFAGYIVDLYRFDQLYRHFCEAADFAEAEGWDILKTLRGKIEDCYGNWYLSDLALKWGRHVEAGLLDTWRIDGIDPQQNFYIRHVAPLLEKGDERRVFVIVSDAFRYEAARELTDQLNGRYRFTAELQCLLGVLPSYTALGMAALLPHDGLDYSDAGQVLADGQSTSGTANRNKILASVKGVALKADDFMAMKKLEGRDFLKPYRVVYIYHNQIDQTADTGNEEKTFNAVRTTIDELDSLVSRIINTLNGTHVLVTADHGFLFQEAAPGETDRSVIADRPTGSVVAKKRYLIGKNLPDHPGAHHGSTATTAGAGGGMDFWVPKGANRFHFVGGSRFIHGGAMPQEIAIPLIKIAQAKGKSIEKTKTKTVGVSILGNSIKITTSRHKFTFIQTEPVSERVKALTVKAAIYEDAEPVTNVETLTFDNASRDMNEWRKEIWLSLAGRSYSKQGRYQLILRNAETGVEEARMDVSIALAIENDF